MVSERLAGQVAGLEHVLERVALEANLERRILVERGERTHGDIGGPADLSRAHELDVPPAGAVARLAVDAQRGESRGVAPLGGVERRHDLAAVARLAVRV